VDSKQASVSLEPLAYDKITKTMQSHQTEEAMISMGAMKKQSEKDKIKDAGTTQCGAQSYSGENMVTHLGAGMPHDRTTGDDAS